MGSRAPTVDSPYVAAARERKAVELEDIARLCRVSSQDLVREDVRKQLLDILSEQRGKRVSASRETWALLWTFMHDHEHGADGDRNPFATAA